MIISTKGRYGVRAMFVLAQNYENGPMSIKNIAADQQISEMYLEQIFSKLRRGELILSLRGAQGGYVLAREPKDISVGDILHALEGPLAPADCVVENDCINAGKCGTRAIWKRIYDGINDVVDSISLQDMLNDYNSEFFITDKENCK